MVLKDNEFLKQFEQQTLDPNEFNHIAHLRIAWLYMNKFDLKTAIKKVTSGISSYANSLGASNKFNHTLTEATIYIMAERSKKLENNSFQTFLAKNPDLIEDLLSLISQHYTIGRLNSKDAKIKFIAPDLQPFNLLS